MTLKATSVADGTKSASATITVTAGGGGTVAVALTPKRGGIVVSQALKFTATVANDTGNQGVTWSVTGPGTLSGQTLTTATLTGTAAGSAVVTATSNADVTKNASVTIGITDLAGVFTYHNNNNRDGSNTREFALTPSNVYVDLRQAVFLQYGRSDLRAAPMGAEGKYWRGQAQRDRGGHYAEFCLRF